MPLNYTLKPKFPITRFLQTVDHCRGPVLFEDEEGGQLDLKSQLSKYLFLTMKPGEASLSRGRLVCEDEDALLLSDYINR